MVFNSPEYRRFEARLRLGLNELASEVSNRNWNEPMKPWNEFFERFTMPKTDFQVISNRVVLNTNIYQTNYLLIVGALFLIFFLRKPSALFVIASIIVAYVYVVRSPRPLVINGKRISLTDRYRAFFALSFLATLTTGVFSSTLQIASLSAWIVLTHAALRHTNVRQKVQRFARQTSDSW